MFAFMRESAYARRYHELLDPAGSFTLEYYPSAPCGASTADPVLLVAFASVDLVSWTACFNVYFGGLRSLAFGFC